MPGVCARTTPSLETTARQRKTKNALRRVEAHLILVQSIDRRRCKERGRGRTEGNAVMRVCFSGVSEARRCPPVGKLRTASGGYVTSVTGLRFLQNFSLLLQNIIQYNVVQTIIMQSGAFSTLTVLWPKLQKEDTNNPVKPALSIRITRKYCKKLCSTLKRT